MKITIILIAIFVPLTVFLRNYSLNKLLHELYKLAYVKKDEKGFLLQLSSLQADMLMSFKSRKMMELNYWVYNDNVAQVKKTADLMEKQRLNAEDAVALYSLLIGYYADKKDKQGLVYLEKLNKYSSMAKQLNQQVLINDSNLVCDIYLKNNVQLIPKIEGIISEEIDKEAKSVYQYRLAYLYKVNGDIQKCESSLKDAMENTSKESSKIKIKKILDGGCKEL